MNSYTWHRCNKSIIILLTNSFQNNVYLRITMTQAHKNSLRVNEWTTAKLIVTIAIAPAICAGPVGALLLTEAFQYNTAWNRWDLRVNSGDKISWPLTICPVSVVLQAQLWRCNMQKSFCHFLIVKILIVCLISVCVTKQALGVKNHCTIKTAVKYIFNNQK